MLKVNYDILPEKRQPEISIVPREIHNAFYVGESHQRRSLIDYHGVYADDYFGFQLSEGDD